MEKLDHNCNIKILISNKNFVVFKDTITGIYWAYSYNLPIAFYDGKLHIYKENLHTYASNMHKGLFEKFLKEILK